MIWKTRSTVGYIRHFTFKKEDNVTQSRSTISSPITMGNAIFPLQILRYNYATSKDARNQ